jgi:hypothetical protein
MTTTIPNWINSYSPAAYNALVSQEAYAVSVDSINWPPLFVPLVSALNAWYATNRSGDVSNLITPAYQNYALGQIYGTDTSQLAACDGLVVFSVAGFLTAAASRPSTYYNDLVAIPPVPPATLTTYSSAKMAADIATATGAITTEQSTIKSLSGTLSGIGQSVIVNMLFQDAGAPLNPFTKASAATFFFNTLHYKAVYQNLSVSPLTLPPGV